VLFDRSWYNRAGVERVMGFCTPEQYQRFMQQVPLLERSPGKPADRQRRRPPDLARRRSAAASAQAAAVAQTTASTAARFSG
jgi:Polyphosphate kinase 2 (PPK2)